MRHSLFCLDVIKLLLLFWRIKKFCVLQTNLLIFHYKENFFKILLLLKSICRVEKNHDLKKKIIGFFLFKSDFLK